MSACKWYALCRRLRLQGRHRTAACLWRQNDWTAPDGTRKQTVAKASMDGSQSSTRGGPSAGEALHLASDGGDGPRRR